MIKEKGRLHERKGGRGRKTGEEYEEDGKRREDCMNGNMEERNVKKLERKG